MQKITPFLWFNNNAEEAMNLYLSTFQNSAVEFVSRMGPDGPASFMKFKLDGLEFYALNGGDYYQIGPGISLFVNCETQEEIDQIWEKFSDGGQVLQCGWITDRFGVTWQIIPSILGELMGDPDPVKSGRVRDAMMQMIKLDIEGLKAAYAGD